MYAEVIVNNPRVEGTFHYHIPAEMAGHVGIGHLVEVSFGRGLMQGVVYRLDQYTPYPKTKPIRRLIERRPVLNPNQLALVNWLAETYHAPLAQAVRLFLPPGMSKLGDTLFTPLIEPAQIEPDGDTQKRLLMLLEKHGPLRGRQIKRSMPRRDWGKAATALEDRGLLRIEPVLEPPSVSVKEVRMVDLAVQPERVEPIIGQHLNPADLPATRQGAARRRADILRLLARHPHGMSISEVYATVEGSNITDLRVLAEDDWITLRREEVWRDSLEDYEFLPDQPPTLTPDQGAAWEHIERAMEAEGPVRPFLLHGVTGSGKTELYLRAVEKALERGQSALVLVPEIALTPQTVRRFGARFPGVMGVFHSDLSPGERYDTWRRAHSGAVRLVIGPRSALFTPVQELGVIVIDECHDDSYKQSPPVIPPYYHAVAAATELARLHEAALILGSATPDVVTYAASALAGADQGAPIVRLDLPTRIMGHRQAIEARAVHYRIAEPKYSHLAGDPDQAVMIDLPPVDVVDMRQELRANNRSLFSRLLREALVGTLQRGEQAILFLNRRGKSTYVFCRTCGYVFTCPNDDTPLTWHTYRDSHGKEQGFLVCHHCNHREGHPAVCPECGSDQVKYFGAGTQRVEAEIEKLYPGVRTLRWDQDTTTQRNAHFEIMQQFVRQEADVLIGTQMVAKGLDLPLVTLVGVISADVALNLPDYRNGEQTFQLLTQVAGRAGRGLLGGRVVLQTYSPEHYAIQAASRHDYGGFYDQEMRYRQALIYPPYSRLVRLVVRSETAEKAESEARNLHGLIAARIREEGLNSTALIGPAPCFYPRLRGRFRWQIIIRGPEPARLLEDIVPGPELVIDVDPVSLL